MYNTYFGHHLFQVDFKITTQFLGEPFKILIPPSKGILHLLKKNGIPYYIEVEDYQE